MMSMGNIGIGFAIPVNMALNIVERLFEGDGKVERGFLGVRLRPMDADWAEALGRPDYSGALVDEVVPQTPAAKAGFKYDDLIIEYEGQKVTDANKLRLDIGDTSPGGKVRFKIVRSGKEKEITAVLGSLDRAALAGRPGGSEPEEEDNKEQEFIDGVEVANITPRVQAMLGLEANLKGVLVQSVSNFSAAAEAGLQSGDIITEVNRVVVETIDEAISERKRFKGNVIILRVYSPSRDESNSIIVRLK